MSSLWQHAFSCWDAQNADVVHIQECFSYLKKSGSWNFFQLLKTSCNIRQRTSIDWEILEWHCKHLSRYLTRKLSASSSIVVLCHLQSRDMLQQCQIQTMGSSLERDLWYAHLMLWTQQLFIIFLAFKWVSVGRWKEKKGRKI